MCSPTDFLANVFDPTALDNVILPMPSYCFQNKSQRTYSDLTDPIKIVHYFFFNLFPISHMLHTWLQCTDLIPVSWIQIFQVLPPQSLGPLCSIGQEHSSAVSTWVTWCFFITSYLGHTSKIVIAYNLKSFPSTLACIFNFLCMLLIIIFIFYYLCSQLKYKLHKSEDFCLFCIMV